jgi:ribosomal protein S18 acetylase RimI-like enzyme
MFSIASQSEAEKILSSLALGFSADPFIRWLYPEPHAFLEHFPRVMNLHGGRAFEHGTAYRNEDCTACALWLPPDVHPDEMQLVAYLEKTVAQEKHKRMFAMFEQIGHFHPQDPCWYLSEVAVDPAYQGKGLGSSLLKVCLKKCDSDGRPAYLESTNPSNLPLYKRMGFEQIGLIETDRAPPLFPMLRPPA